MPDRILVCLYFGAAVLVVELAEEEQKNSNKYPQFLFINGFLP